MRELLKAEILQRIDSEASKEDLIDYLFDKNLLNEKHCRVAVIYERYIGRLGECGSMEAMRLTAEEMDVSKSTVENAVYYFKRIRF